MIGVLKLRIATVLAGSYLCIFIALLIGIARSNHAVSSDAFLVSFAIALPWSYWLGGALFRNISHSGGTPTFFFLMSLCALGNGTVVYLFGLLITKVVSSLGKRFSFTPQD